jgi:hypothetical protein
MGKKIMPLLFVSAVMLAAAVAFTDVVPATAGKGGCPNEAATNGAAHANANSAHGLSKRAASDCQLAEPTPEPIPTPEPTDGTDVREVSVTVRAPDSALVGQEFVVRVSASLRNEGPENDVLVDTTFTFGTPPDCFASPPSPVTVEDKALPEGVGVSIGRSWLVSCVEPGTHTFTADVTVTIDPTQSVTDLDMGNNSGSGADTPEVGS